MEEGILCVLSHLAFFCSCVSISSRHCLLADSLKELAVAFEEILLFCDLAGTYYLNVIAPHLEISILLLHLSVAFLLNLYPKVCF